MQKYEAGKLFKPGKTHYQEGIKFDFNQSGGALYIMYDRPTPKEIEEIRRGKLQLGILEKSDIIFLLFKFGSLNWMDTPYSCHLSEPYVFDEVEEGTGYGMTVFLIDAATGILKVIRQIGWPSRMSRLFTSYVIEQQNKPFDRAIYDRVLNNIYNNYTTDSLVRMAQTFRLREE